MGVIFTRKGLETTASFEATLINITCNALLLWPISLAHAPPRELLNPALLFLVLAGVFVPCISRVLNFIGYVRLGVPVTQAFYSTHPIFAVAIAVLFLGERPSLWVLLGVLIVAAGLVCLAAVQGAGKITRMNDVLYPLGAAALLGARDVLARFALAWVAAAEMGGAVAASTSAVILWAYALGVRRQPLRLVTPGFRMLVGSGVAWGISYAFMFNAFKAGPIYVVSPVLATIPLYTLGLSLLFLRRLEIITRRIVVGTALVVLGVILISLART
ncbi:MAG: DMT family transporter [Deltaproteobacteria bacterium]|nr:DMT family transporter [Deltaproteobacteria bacterium]